MAKKTHINVTVDLSNWGEGTYDLRIPVQVSVKQLQENLIEALKINSDKLKDPRFALKITTKELFLTDDDYLIDFPVTDGDVLIVL